MPIVASPSDQLQKQKFSRASRCRTEAGLSFCRMPYLNQHASTSEKFSELIIPRIVLKNYSIAVWIFECESVEVPIWIERLNGCESGLAHSLNGKMPFVGAGKIKDQQIFLCGCARCSLSAFSCELQVIGPTFLPQHYSVETIVIFKSVEYHQAKAVAVKSQERLKIIGWTCDTQYWCVHSGIDHNRLAPSVN
jgi:hypothetical protein